MGRQIQTPLEYQCAYLLAMGEKFTGALPPAYLEKGKQLDVSAPDDVQWMTFMLLFQHYTWIPYGYQSAEEELAKNTDQNNYNRSSGVSSSSSSSRTSTLPFSKRKEEAWLHDIGDFLSVVNLRQREIWEGHLAEPDGNFTACMREHEMFSSRILASSVSPETAEEETVDPLRLALGRNLATAYLFQYYTAESPRLVDKIPPLEFLSGSYSTQGGEQSAFGVALDHFANALVIFFRGSKDLMDVISNAAVAPVPLFKDSHPVDEIVHAGFRDCALHALEHIEDRKLLLRLPASYSLVVAGHSLGAGCAAVLGFLLARRYPELRTRTGPGGGSSRLKCLLVAPPGLTCSKKLREDLVPRSRPLSGVVVRSFFNECVRKTQFSKKNLLDDLVEERSGKPLLGCSRRCTACWQCVSCCCAPGCCSGRPNVSVFHPASPFNVLCARKFHDSSEVNPAERCNFVRDQIRKNDRLRVCVAKVKLRCGDSVKMGDQQVVDEAVQVYSTSEQEGRGALAGGRAQAEVQHARPTRSTGVLPVHVQQQGYDTESATDEDNDIMKENAASCETSDAGGAKTGHKKIWSTSATTSLSSSFLSSSSSARSGGASTSSAFSYEFDDDGTDTSSESDAVEAEDGTRTRLRRQNRKHFAMREGDYLRVVSEPKRYGVWVRREEQISSKLHGRAFFLAYYDILAAFAIDADDIETRLQANFPHTRGSFRNFPNKARVHASGSVASGSVMKTSDRSSSGSSGTSSADHGGLTTANEGRVSVASVDSVASVKSTASSSTRNALAKTLLKRWGTSALGSAADLEQQRRAARDREGVRSGMQRGAHNSAEPEGEAAAEEVSQPLEVGVSAGADEQADDGSGTAKNFTRDHEVEGEDVGPDPPERSTQVTWFDSVGVAEPQYGGGVDEFDPDRLDTAQPKVSRIQILDRKLERIVADENDSVLREKKAERMLLREKSSKSRGGAKSRQEEHTDAVSHDEAKDTANNSKGVRPLAEDENLTRGDIPFSASESDYTGSDRTGNGRDLGRCRPDDETWRREHRRMQAEILNGSHLFSALANVARKLPLHKVAIGGVESVGQQVEEQPDREQASKDKHDPTGGGIMATTSIEDVPLAQELGGLAGVILDGAGGEAEGEHESEGEGFSPDTPRDGIPDPAGGGYAVRASAAEALWNFEDDEELGKDKAAATGIALLFSERGGFYRPVEDVDVDHGNIGDDVASTSRVEEQDDDGGNVLSEQYFENHMLQFEKEMQRELLEEADLGFYGVWVTGAEFKFASVHGRCLADHVQVPYVAGTRSVLHEFFRE
eukprot:g6716.t1